MTLDSCPLACTVALTVRVLRTVAKAEREMQGLQLAARQLVAFL